MDWSSAALHLGNVPTTPMMETRLPDRTARMAASRRKSWERKVGIYTSNLQHYEC